MAPTLLAAVLMLVVVQADGGSEPSSSSMKCACVGTTAVSCTDLGRLPVTTRSFHILNTSRPDIVADISAVELPGLTELALTNCSIRELQGGQFASLHRVTTLNLTSNFITNIPEGVFANLSSLRVLNLSRNSIFDISSRWLQDLRSLQVLDVSVNNVSSVDEGALSCLPALQMLSLSENRLSAVPSRMFNGLNNTLHCLDLSFNEISLLNAGVFDGLQRLRTLNLAGNNLRILHRLCFNELISLQQLDLSENNISSLDNCVFDELNNLQRLNLSGNRLEALSDQCFCGLTNLQQLDVSRNRISSVSPGAFQPLEGLMELILADNPELGRLQHELAVLVATGRRLQIMDVSRSGLTQVPAAITRSIRTLQMAGNSVTAVRCGDMDSYTLLQLLNLADNRIEQVEEDALGRLEVLLTLDLSGNHLHIVPRSLPSGLVTLHLQDNSFQELNSSDFKGLPCLKFLSLRRSGVMIIQNGALSQLTALETLDMSENPLKSLPGNALSGPRMTVLRLSHLVGIMSSAFNTTEMSFPVTSPERLEVLELDSSPVLAKQLLADTAALAAFRQLRELNLVNTGLTNLRTDLFHFLPRLRTLRLNGNLWECDNMLWLANWIRQQQKQQQQELENSLQDAYCASPQHLASRLVIHIHNADFNITTSSTQPSTVFSMPENSNAYEATTETRYDASVTTEMFSIFIISSTEVPHNKTLFIPPPEDHSDNKSQQRLSIKQPGHSIQPFNTNRNSTTITFKAVEMPLDNVANTVGTTMQPGNSSSANTAFSTPTIFTESEELLFSATTDYEDQFMTNINFTDSLSVTSTPVLGDDFKTAYYTDIKTSETSSADEVFRNSTSSSTVSPTMSYKVTYPTDDRTEQNTVALLTTPSLKSQLKVINNSVHDEKSPPFTGKNSTDRKEKSSCHIKNVTTTQNQSTTSRNEINIRHTNITLSENRKIYINVSSNSTRTLLANKSWVQHKFFRNSKNKGLPPSTEHFQGMHNNLNLYKVVSNSLTNNTAIKQTSSNKGSSKFQHYHDKPLNNAMQGDESLNADSQENITRNNVSLLEASHSNKTSVKRTNNSSDLTNKHVYNTEFNYYNMNTNTSTNHSTSNSKIKVKIPSYRSVHNSVHRNHSTRVPIAIYASKLKSVERNNLESLDRVVPEQGNATSSGNNDGANITYINKIHGESGNTTNQPHNITSPLEGENLVLENVTPAMVDKSVFYSSHASDALASSVNVTVKENVSTSPFSGSHPSMFVLLGVGLATVGAFVMAISHCAKRRRRQAVEYSRQQDIEVRSMSSIGDLW